MQLMWGCQGMDGAARGEEECPLVLEAELTQGFVPRAGC